MRRRSRAVLRAPVQRVDFRFVPRRGNAGTKRSDFVTSRAANFFGSGALREAGVQKYRISQFQRLQGIPDCESLAAKRTDRSRNVYADFDSMTEFICYIYKLSLFNSRNWLNNL